MPPFGAFHDIAKGRAAVLFLKANDVDHPDKLPILFFVQAESFVLRIGVISRPAPEQSLRFFHFFMRVPGQITGDRGIRSPSVEDRLGLILTEISQN